MAELGGFSFRVGLDVTQAQQGLQRLIQASQQAAQQVQANLSRTAVNVDTRPAEQAFARIRQVREQATGSATITVRAEATEATASLDRLAGRAREIGGNRINLTVRADGSQQAEQSIERVSLALQHAKAGERVNITVRANGAEEADNVIRRLIADVNTAKAASARVAINVQTTGAQGQGFLQQAQGGFIQQITPGLATGAAAAVGVGAAIAVERLTGAIRNGIAAGIEYNSRFEQIRNTFEHFTGSAAGATQAIAGLQKLATTSPFQEQQVIAAGAGFLRISGGDIQRAQELTELTVALAAAHPELGFERMDQAMKQLISGDFRAFEDGTNTAFGTVKRLSDQGVSGMELYRRAVEAAGGSIELLNQNATTFQARLTTTESGLNKLLGAATQPVFKVMSEQLAELNSGLEKNGTEWAALATQIGQAVASAVSDIITLGKAFEAALNKPVPGFNRQTNPLFAGAADLGRTVQTALFGTTLTELTGAGQRPIFGATPPPAPVTVEARAGESTADAQARQDAAAALTAQLDAAGAAVARQKSELKEIEQQLTRNAAAASTINEVYRQALAPLEQQSRDLSTRQRTVAELQRSIADRTARAQPPVAVRAEAAAQTVQLDHEQEILDIRHRRAELSDQIAAAEERAANNVAEAQIRAAERGLRALQEQARANQEARQQAIEALRDEQQAAQETRRERLEGLQDEIRGNQEARSAALDGIREVAAAQNQARQDELDGLRESIRTRRAGVADAIEAAHEISRATQEAFQDSEREAQRAHSAEMEDINDEIAALREKLNVRRGDSAAERELAAFDRSERERSRQERLSDAQRAISTARTGTELRAAALAFQRTRQDIAADVKREQLQDRIERERKEADDRREKIQERISALQKQAQDDDRRFQREREDARDRNEQQQRADQAAERATAKAERETQRAEDARVRDLEKADREADRAAQKLIQDTEKANQEADRADRRRLVDQQRADQEQDRKERRELLNAERADRDAARADQAQIRGIQAGIQGARDVLSDAEAAAQAERDDAALGRLRESADLEQRRLDIRQELADKTDVAAAAQAARDKVYADEAERRLSLQRAAIDANIAAVKTNLAADLATIDADTKAAEDRIAQIKVELDTLEKRINEIKGQQAALVSGGTAEGGAGTPASQPAAPAASTFDSIWKSITDGLASWLGGAGALTDVFTTWAADHIAALAAAWETASPSQVTYRLGGEIGQGLVDGIAAAQQAISDAFTSTVQAAWDDGSAIVDSVISEIALRFGGSDAIDLPAQVTAQAPAVGQAISDVFTQGWAQGGAAGVDAVLDQIGAHFATVGDQIDSQQNERAVEQAIEDLFGVNVLDRAFRNVDRNMEIYGNNAAVSFIDGWTAQMSSWQPYVPAPTGGGGGGINAQGGVGTTAYGPTSTNLSGQTTSMGYPILPGTQDITTYLVGKGYVQGTDDFHRLFEQLVSDMYDNGQLPPPDMVVTGRRFGGDYQPDQAYLLHKDEIMVPNSAGQVLPPEFLAGVKAMASSGGGAIAAASAGGAPQVSFNFNDGAFRVTSSGNWGGIDRTMLETRLARHGNEIMDDLVDILHASQRHAPVRSDRDLGGAR